ncbi:MAG TPA: hypothetical protein VK426_05040 [Methanobacterium sp.]|nr:hypothetical protein [Methanobacterium sp.]
MVYCRFNPTYSNFNLFKYISSRFAGLIYREGQPYLEDDQKIESNSEIGENQDIETV